MPDGAKEFDNYLIVKQMLYNYKKVPLIELSSRKVDFFFLPYARLFEGRCFLKASVSRNKLILKYAIGLLPPRDRKDKSG